MPKKSYALRNRHGYMDSTFDEGLRIVLQWLEQRRRDFELLLQKELYMLRRMFHPRHTFYHGLLPGGPNDAMDTVREEINWLHNIMHSVGYYAPGY